MPASFAEVVAIATAIRHDLHRHPELGMQEYRTAGQVRARLVELGIPFRVVAGTGTVATVAGSRSGPVVGLRAELDALPMCEQTGLAHASTASGIMHACGHDGHAAALLGLAHLAVERRERLAGTLVLLFQPGEEGLGGAALMLADDALRGVESVYALHNWPTIPGGRSACPDGPIMSANGSFRIRIEGRGGHASQPDDCRDPVHAGAMLVGMLQSLVSREAAPQEAAVVGVSCFQAGTAVNVIPDRAELAGTIRALSTSRREQLATRIREQARYLGQALGVDIQVDYRPHYPPVLNHQAQAAILRAALAVELGPALPWTTRIPCMGADDFALFLEQVPGAYALLGSGSGVGPPCHSSRYDFADTLLPTMIRIWARLVGIWE